VTHPHNHCIRVSNDGSVLCKPNTKESMIRKNMYTLSRDVGTFNISYDGVGIVLG